jgi:hypothetical protein
LSESAPTGFKGRHKAIPKQELYERVEALLGVPTSHIVAEYGMTELSSQLYEGGKAVGSLGGQEGLLVAPPWLRVVVVDPASLRPVSPGQPGLAKFIDLANVDSAVCVLTQDLVVQHPEGLELIGRRPGAAARGCSLGAEAWLQRGHGDMAE